ncbi:hypothetical protein [Microbulbifer sp. HZ11]|uniref:hypothetical protein n=1 Tax=Microbulbifer sp. HZ11 TaxID=1453501 RepID=UPI0012DBFBB3|nr:hypothetical protein [Microbulbifer sp. HZ11]
MKLMGKEKFRQWKEERNIPENVSFGTSRAYYGLCFRSRPGALYIDRESIVHWSYGPSDCSAAMFEKEIKISIPLESVKSVKVEKLSFWWKLAFMGAKWVVKIETDSDLQEVVLYEDPSDLVAPIQAASAGAV